MHLDITVTLYNSSKVSLALDEADFSVQQIAPVSDEEIEELYAQVFEDEDEIHLQWLTLDEAHHDWDIGEMVVEPGESHQETYEFIVPSPVETVLVYTYFRNPQHSRSSRSAEGWGATTVYDTIRNDR